MLPQVILLILLVLGGFALFLIGKIFRTQEAVEQLTRRQDRLERELEALRKELGESTRSLTPEVSKVQAVTSAVSPVQRPEPETLRQETFEPEPWEPEPLVPQPERAGYTPVPPPIPPLSPMTPPPPISATAPVFASKINKIDWEQFLGVKGLMWLGGFAAFLTVIFAIKYSFERNLITPELRAFGGFVTGIGLLIAGGILHRRRQYLVGSQTLCATGIVILYANSFACRSVYHLPLFSPIPTFLVMVLVTATAFVLAVRLNALVVAILGICGGFLTPFLLSTGTDNPLGLFGYIALLDAGLIALALRPGRPWDFLTVLGAAGTALTQIVWVAAFFLQERYFEGNKVLVPLGVYFGFSLLFTAAWAWAQRQARSSIWLTASALLVSGLGLLFTVFLLQFNTLGDRPGLIFAYVLLVDLCLIAMACRQAGLELVQLAAGAGVFLLLTLWTVKYLSMPFLGWALTLYFGFALLHSALPFVVQRLRRDVSPVWWAHLFPPVALLLMLAPIVRLETASWLTWPFVLLVDALALALAFVSASVLAIFGVLVLTAILAAVWIGVAPGDLSFLPGQLLVVGGFAFFFLAGGILLLRKLSSQPAAPSQGAPSLGGGLSEAELRAQVPAFSTILPFLLLILITQRLPLANPSPVFGLAFVLAVVMLGLTWFFPLSWLPAVGLGCVLLLEHTWHFEHFRAAAAGIPLLWYIGFLLLFTGFPFLSWRRLSATATPWVVAALAGPLHFYLVHDLVRSAWPNDYMGLLALAFAVPPLIGLVFLARNLPGEAPRRLTLLALFGAATLFFVTLAVPLQFDRQWITIGWALEGAALLWLFHRLPHNGLRLGGVGLLIIAFVRLALNPAVLQYHERAGVPIWNWYFYAYGTVAAALFVGAWLLAPPRQIVWGSNARVVLATLGTILVFLLLNIEIADYFTPPGSRFLTLEFSGNLGRDMTYSIAWAAFALILLVFGIARRIPGTRYAGMALLGVTTLKLFLHDLAQLQALYRIGALLGVALIAIAASLLYQRFFARKDEEKVV